MKKVFCLIGILLLISIIIVGCSQSPSTQTPQTSSATKSNQTSQTSSAPQTGGTLKILSTLDVNSVGLALKMVSPEDNYQCYVSEEPLVRLDDQCNPIPYLAESWKEDPATNTITMKLKKGIKFHDGTDFNAESVKWNMDFDKKGGMSAYRLVSSVDVVDDYTIKITLNAWNNTFLYQLSSLGGLQISPTAYQKNGQDWAIKNPVGTGPFKLVSWNTDVNKVYERFPDYWQKGKPYLDKIQIDVIADPTVEMTSFLKGEGDLVNNVSPKDAADLMNNKAVTIKQSSTQGFWRGYWFNSLDPKSPFNNLKVRQAINYAIDKESINKPVFYGLGSTTNQFSRNGAWSYNPNVAGYPYNPEKAKQLLTEAGYSNGFKTNIYFRIDPVLSSFCTITQSNLKKIGIDAQLQGVDKSRYSAMMMAQGCPDGLLVADFGYSAETYALMGVFLKTSTLGPAIMTIRPDDVDSTIQKGQAATDFNAKKDGYQQVQSLIIDKYCLVVPMNIIGNFTVRYNKVHDDGFGTPHMSLWTPEKIWIEK
jgi:peptide/nickel transport system substrate-binding protein